MKTEELIQKIESERLKLKLHKATLCRLAGITTTYYNRLLDGKANPAFTIIVSLVNAVGLSLLVGKVDLERLE